MGFGQRGGERPVGALEIGRYRMPKNGTARQFESVREGERASDYMDTPPLTVRISESLYLLRRTTLSEE